VQRRKVPGAEPCDGCKEIGVCAPANAARLHLRHVPGRMPCSSHKHSNATTRTPHCAICCIAVFPFFSTISCVSAFNCHQAILSSRLSFLFSHLLRFPRVVATRNTTSLIQAAKGRPFAAYRPSTRAPLLSAKTLPTIRAQREAASKPTICMFAFTIENGGETNGREAEWNTAAFSPPCL
jgi:hypothetical protein